MTLLDSPKAPEWDGTWVPGPPQRGNRVWAKRLAPLRERPGEWAKFGPFCFDTTRKQVSIIKRGKYGPGFDAVSKAEGGRDWIYVTYSPPLSDTTEGT